MVIMRMLKGGTLGLESEGQAREAGERNMNGGWGGIICEPHEQHLGS
jgi:hypothetical protein